MIYLLLYVKRANYQPNTGSKFHDFFSSIAHASMENRFHEFISFIIILYTFIETQTIIDSHPNK